MKVKSKILVLLVLALPAAWAVSCSPGIRTVETTALPGPDWQARIAVADALYARGHYTGLKEAFLIYKDALNASPLWRDAVAEKYVRTAIAVGLRGKLLGIRFDEDRGGLGPSNPPGAAGEAGPGAPRPGVAEIVGVRPELARYEPRRASRPAALRRQRDRGGRDAGRKGPRRILRLDPGPRQTSRRAPRVARGIRRPGRRHAHRPAQRLRLPVRGRVRPRHVHRWAPRLPPRRVPLRPLAGPGRPEATSYRRPLPPISTWRPGGGFPNRRPSSSRWPKSPSSWRSSTAASNTTRRRWPSSRTTGTPCSGRPSAWDTSTAVRRRSPPSNGCSSSGATTSAKPITGRPGT